MAYFINNFLKFVFLLTPFFVLSMFLSMTQGWAMRQKRLLALRIGIAAFCTCMILLFFGKWIFEAFDITLDAFRIGGGALLFLSAVGLVNGKVEDKKPLAVEDDSEARISDIAVVPLGDTRDRRPRHNRRSAGDRRGRLDREDSSFERGALALALFCLTSILFVATWIEQKFGRHVIVILSKVTGLILAAMASQMIFTGVRSFLVP